MSSFNFNLLALLWLALLATFVGAQVAQTGNCPDVSVQPNLNTTCYTGLWYEYARTDYLPELATRCNRYNFFPQDNNDTTIISNERVLDFFNFALANNGTLEFIEPGVFTKPDGYNYHILDTDCEDYEVIYKCLDTLDESGDDAYMEVYWLLTRDQYPDDDVVDPVLAGFDDVKWIQTDQDDCDV